VNILFVNYGDFTSNSLNHIAAFADQLTRTGHACVVAVPENPETISVIREPLFTPVTFDRALEPEPLFPDRGPADVVHAWTPRENVREFTLVYLRKHPGAALVIHLEDNEALLLERFAAEPLEVLRQLSDEELAARLSPRLAHPVRFKNFLRVAHAVTYITDRLCEFIPDGKPSHRLLPGIDFKLHPILPSDPTLRSVIGVGSQEKIIVFTGGTTFANLADIRSLLLAVRLINERGTPCKLVRTGINPPQFAQELEVIGSGYVIELGFVEKDRLPALLALADVLVQPGAPNRFNDYRLPSKIPEFLCAGRPVVVPRANIALEMEDGLHALLLETGQADEIVDRCLRIFHDEALARRLSEGGPEFARTHFDLTRNTGQLASFYQRITASAQPIFSDPGTPPSEDVLLAEGDVALRMRAKEQTIIHSRQTIAMLEASVRAAHADAEAERDRSSELRAAAAKLAEDRETMIRASIERLYKDSKLQNERHKVEILRAQLGEAVASFATVTRHLDETKSRAETLAAELRQREHKIARMTDSFSWRATGPLRSLRRLIIDPLRNRSSSGRKPAPTVDPAFSHQIDTPCDWSEMPSEGSLRGWIIASDGTTVVAVRMRAGDTIFEAQYHLDRPDVSAAHPYNSSASTSGFALEYSLPPDSTPSLAFEALTSDGRWRCFAQPEARIRSSQPEDAQHDYPAWVRRFDTPSLDQMVSVRAWIETLDPAQCPHISLLMPTYNPPAQWLVKAIESVRAQYYPHWELCIADDASTEPHVRRILEDYARRDERIRIMLRETNGHISAASNSALALATGEFIALLDHDDELAPHALSEVVLALVQQPDLEFIYSDEDKIDEHGQRFTPYFKPDWNPDLLLAQNYTSHFSVFRTTRLRAIGGFREGYEGSQDWDLTLRATEGLDPARIRHLPRVLYHWRAIPGSTALSVDEKSYPVEAARKALADHFDRCGERVDLELLPGNYWRAKRALPQAIPLVSLVIPTRNRVDLLSTCLGSILEKTRYPRFEIIVVDNRSDDPATLDYLSRLDSQRIRVLRYDEPFNYSAINNYAAAHVRGEIIGLLNNDLEVINGDWLDEMVSQAVRPEIGCVGAMLYYPDDTIQHAGVILGLGGVANHAYYKAPRSTDHHFNRAHLVQSYSAVTGACLLVRKEIFDTIGGLNEQDLPIAFNDVDFCLRVMEAGYRNLWTPFAEFYHHESATRGTEDTSEKLERFKNEVAYMRQRWGRLLDNDPAYNRNLSLQHQDFSLSFPPR
jgi:GT2 family glycosyltransferase/glycosyltransferase involved in cell wall biosynthesis